MNTRFDNRKVLHLYQNTPDGALLFYSVSDFLVYFTIICTNARKYDIKLLGVCPMYDHLHNLTVADSRDKVAGFVGAYTRHYSRELNSSLGFTGPVFNPSFGCAVKTGDKAIRTACSYLYNNPGEKGLCKRSEQYRWTFLAYAVSDHPFSEKIVMRRASSALRKALKEVCYMREHDKALNHAILTRLFEGLGSVEKNQLTDYIIVKYNCIDYDSLISLYGSYDKMCLAFASNQGKEYDINESFEPGGHTVYPTLSATLHNQFGFKNVKDIFKLSPADQESLARKLFYATDAYDWQIRKYFRWKKA